MTALTDLDIRELWSEVSYQPDESTEARQTRFLRNMGRRCNQTLAVMRDQVPFCIDCEEPEHLASTSPARGGRVCESCRIDEWWWCNDCNLWNHYEEYNSTADDTGVCDWCVDNYFYCDMCELYYSNDSGHTHGGDDGCCESPAQVFVVGTPKGPLTNDTRITVALDEGRINGAGRDAITQRMRVWSANTPSDEFTSAGINVRQAVYEAAHSVGDHVGWEWTGANGNFTTRLKRSLYNAYKLRIPAEVLTEIGNIANTHLTGGEHTVAVTRDLNLGAHEFHHGGSCWWSDYSYSRCTLKSNGGFGLRSFDGPHVTGRAWVMPLKVRTDRPASNRDYQATFDTRDPDAWVVFNGYGNLDGHMAAAVMSDLLGLPYRPVTFGVSRMYVNSEHGYLLVAHGPEVSDLYLDTSDHSDLYHDEQQSALNLGVGDDNAREQDHVFAEAF